MGRDEPRFAARGLTPMAVRNYATGRGWVLDPRVKDRFWLLTHPEHPLRQLLVPKDVQDPGFEDGMIDVATRLADLEQRSLATMLVDLQTADADVLRIRLVGPDAGRGDVSLAADVALRDGARRALLASACSVLSPAPYHPRLSKGAADTLLSACRAGQTEVGSYVVRVLCPLHAVEPMSLEPIPFTRRVTISLMRSVDEIVSSIEGGTMDRYVDAQAEHPGLSANLCEALVQLQPPIDEALAERSGGEVEISTTWASDPQVGPPSPAEAPSRVVIKVEYSREIERAAQRLRPGAAESHAQWYIGTVERLDGTIGDDGRRAGEVRLSVLLADGDALRARATLGPEAYAVAVEAHERGRVYVMLYAALHRGRRSAQFGPVQFFARVPEAPPPG
jgi:hypothetical protein